MEWGEPSDLERAREINLRHRKPAIGLVGALVIAVAERLKADSIATLDLRHFAAVSPAVPMRLLPREISG